MLFTVPAIVKNAAGEIVARVATIMIGFKHDPANKGAAQKIVKVHGSKEKTIVRYKQHKNRSCHARLYLVTDSQISMTSKLMRDKKDYCTLLADTEVKFHLQNGVSYCRAYGRQKAAEQLLRAVITGKTDKLPYTTLRTSVPFVTFNDDTFKAVISELRSKACHGVAARDQLSSEYAEDIAFEQKYQKAKTSGEI